MGVRCPLPIPRRVFFGKPFGSCSKWPVKAMPNKTRHPQRAARLPIVHRFQPILFAIWGNGKGFWTAMDSNRPRMDSFGQKKGHDSVQIREKGLGNWAFGRLGVWTNQGIGNSGNIPAFGACPARPFSTPGQATAGETLVMTVVFQRCRLRSPKLRCGCWRSRENDKSMP